jgi:hypothetical protein
MGWSDEARRRDGERRKKGMKERGDKKSQKLTNSRLSEIALSQH